MAAPPGPPLALALLALAAALAPARGRADVPALLLPPSLGRPGAVWVSGRVLEERHGEHGPAWYRTTRTLSGHNLPGVEVQVELLGRTAWVLSGDDGEFEVELRPAPGKCFPPGPQVAEVRAAGVAARAAVLVVAPDAPFLVVSDFDDTLAVTHVTEKRELLASTFLEDAETQPAVPGMAGLLRCLAGAGAPVAIVSGSPAQLAPRLGRFLEKNGFPPAALYLRNLGWSNLSGGYKEPVLARLAERFPGLPFVLLGDSGERDPEVFAAFVKENPGRVLRAYVRKATPEPGPSARFEAMLLFAAPAAAAADAAARGILPEVCAVGR